MMARQAGSVSDTAGCGCRITRAYAWGTSQGPRRLWAVLPLLHLHFFLFVIGPADSTWLC